MLETSFGVTAEAGSQSCSRAGQIIALTTIYGRDSRCTGPAITHTTRKNNKHQLPWKVPSSISSRRERVEFTRWNKPCTFLHNNANTSTSPTLPPRPSRPVRNPRTTSNHVTAHTRSPATSPAYYETTISEKPESGNHSLAISSVPSQPSVFLLLRILSRGFLSRDEIQSRVPS